MQNSDFQSQFSMSEMIQIFLVSKYVSFKKQIFCYWHFLETSIFEPLYFLKWYPIFDKFYSTECKTKKLFNGLVVGFGPKGKPGRMSNSVR